MNKCVIVYFAVVVACFAPSASKAGCTEPINDPEFHGIVEERTSIVVNWLANCDYSHFNIRWERPGKPAAQSQLDGDQRRFVIKNKHSNTVYTFSLQGCDKPLVGRSTCTEWISETVLSCGSRTNPCEHPRGIVHPVRIKSATGKCLDVHAPDRGKNGGRVQVWDCNGEDQQTWIFREKALMTTNGKCLDVQFDQQNKNGGRVQVWDCNGTPPQQWRMVGKTIRSAVGKCLDVHFADQSKNGGLVQVWDCNGERQQRWSGQSW